jgi:hypothetical protein
VRRMIPPPFAKLRVRAAVTVETVAITEAMTRQRRE